MVHQKHSETSLSVDQHTVCRRFTQTQAEDGFPENDVTSMQKWKRSTRTSPIWSHKRRSGNNAHCRVEDYSEFTTTYFSKRARSSSGSGTFYPPEVEIFHEFSCFFFLVWLSGEKMSLTTLVTSAWFSAAWATITWAAFKKTKALPVSSTAVLASGESTHFHTHMLH